MSDDPHSEAGSRVRVADDELAPGDRLVAEVDGVEVGVMNIGGTHYAIRNECPHRGGPVCEGKLTPQLSAEWRAVGERVHERLDGPPAIACPWHGWEFDVSTGVHLGDPSFAVETFEVTIEDGAVFVESAEGDRG